MVLQERDIAVLADLARYFLLTARQVRELQFAGKNGSRICRRRLLALMQAGYVRKRAMHVVNPLDGSTSPTYHLTKHGLEFLAGHFDDPSILSRPLEPSQPQHLHHYAAVADTYRLLDRAITKQSGAVELVQWVHEDEVIDPEVDLKRKLRTEFDYPKKAVCLPDAAFLLKHAGVRAVVYLEQDRDTFFHDRVAARKSPGYRELLTTQRHKEHFPSTQLDFFFVLFVTPTQKRAEQLRQSFAKRNESHDVRKIYRFGSLDQLNDDNFLFEPMLSCCHHDDRVPLIRRVFESAEDASG